MNRAERRAHAQRTAHAVIAATTGVPACPDCTATCRPEEIAPAVVVLHIDHDDSCPAWRDLEERAATNPTTTEEETR